MKVYKYRLSPAIIQDIALPKDAKLLTVGVQDSGAHLWALIDPEAAPEFRRLGIYGTGHPGIPKTATFIGTIFISGLVFHVFELPYEVMNGGVLLGQS